MKIFLRFCSSKHAVIRIRDREQCRIVNDMIYNKKYIIFYAQPAADFFTKI